MKADIDETVLEEAQPILQMKRPLLLIDKYAAREGVSRSIIEKYGQLGIIQIRKYKGQTYVVDVPLSPYYHLSEDAPILQESNKMTTQATQKSQSAPDPRPKTQDSRPKIQSLESGVLNLESGRKARSAQTVTADIHKIAGHPETTSKPVPISQTCRSEFDIITEQVLTKRAWQVAAVVYLCAALLTGLWLYMNQRVHHSRLNQLSANIQNVYDDSVRTGQQLATFQSKLIESTAELELMKSEMESTKVRTESVQQDIKSLRHEITKVREGLETLQQHNTTALEQLKEQFQQLTANLSEFTKNSRTAPGSRDSSK